VFRVSLTSHLLFVRVFLLAPRFLQAWPVGGKCKLWSRSTVFAALLSLIEFNLWLCGVTKVHKLSTALLLTLIEGKTQTDCLPRQTQAGRWSVMCGQG
jgi:hypothetical protein